MTLQKATFSLTMILLATAIPVCLASGNVVAAETDTFKPDKQQNEYPLLEEIERNPLKPPDTSSPRATLKSFLDNANEAYRLVSSAHRDNKNTPGLFTSKTIRKQGQMADQLMQRAIYCLNLSKIPWALKRSTGYEGALFLKELLDRIELPPWEAIPGPEPHETGAQTQKTESLVRWRLPGTQIVIAKVEEGPRQGEFLFSSEIIPLLNTYMNKVIHLPYRTDANTSPGFLKL
jgi:MscS family membrane protein